MLPRIRLKRKKTSGTFFAIWLSFWLNCRIESIANSRTIFDTEPLMRRSAFGFLLSIAFAVPAVADIRLPALFTDHMVLQQGQKNRVWGWADPGEEVIVT